MNATQLAELKQLIPDELVVQLAEATFRESFISDPKGAYRRRFGTDLLPSEEITVEARSDGTKCLYLPRLDARFVVSSESSLSDVELELVVGGTGAADRGQQFFNKITGNQPSPDKNTA
jgi:hypothetical protein